MLGQTISHYRILRKLGEGGMGVVYLAEDTVLGRLVAIKTLIDSGLEQQHFRARFFREAVAVSSMSHTNIATIYDYGHTPEGHPYIVMEFVKGHTLAQLITQGTLSVKRAIEIMIDVARALGEAHRQGMVHRDIKPSNLAINESRQVKVLDFGLAKQVEQPLSESDNSKGQNTQTREGLMVGTPMYASPEQAIGIPVDSRSDLFALGSVLYECVTGKPPFTGNSVVEIRAKVIRDDPPPPSRFNSSVPAELDRLILKSLAKKPDDRYQSAEEWIEDLQSISESLKSQPRPTITNTDDPITEPAPDKPKTVGTKISGVFTHRVSIRTVAVIALVLALGLVGLYFTIASRPYRPLPAAQRAYEAGINRLREGSYVKAIESFQQAISADNNFAMAHAGQAAAYIELDYHEQALKGALQATTLANSNTSKISAADSLYLNGIKAIILQSYDEAITRFEERSRLVSSDRLNSALLDLGRAYEKKEDFVNAEKTYQRITVDTPEYPLAVLRLGVMAGRKQDFDKAKKNFDLSQQLFEAHNNYEGVTAGQYERGSMLITAVSTDDAARELQQALDSARQVTHNKYHEIKILLQLSSVAKEQSKVEDAKSFAQEAMKQASENDMPSLETQALIQLGNVFMFNREYRSAGDYFKQAITSAKRYKGLSTGAQAELALGGLYIQQEENIDEGLKLIDSAVAFFQKGGYTRELWRAMIWRARAQLQRGNYDVAQQILDEWLGKIQPGSDILLTADTHFEKGVLLFNQESYPQALQEFDQSRVGYKKLKNHTKTGYAWLYRGEISWRLGNYPDANEALVEAEKEAGNQEALLVRIKLVKTQMALSQDFFFLAITQGTQLVTLLGSKFKRTSIETKYTLGSAYAAAGSKQGLKESQEAAELATPYPDPRLWANALLALAEVKLANNDVSGAFQNATHAIQLFTKAKQWDSSWRANVVASQASQRLNDYESARQFLLVANNTVVNLRSFWGDEAFQGYSNRPDIKRYSKLLHQAPDVAR